MITLASLYETIQTLAADYRFVKLTRIGKSYLGNPLYALTFGCSEKSLIYAACHHGSEYITSLILLRFAEELARAIDLGDRRFSLDIRRIFESRRLILLPCVNPDGFSLSAEGLDPDSPLAERLYRLNHADPDFSHWQANARGVDLNHNYDYRFCEYKVLERQNGITEGPTRFAGEYPESEPETRAVAKLIREEEKHLSALFSFHSQGEVIYYHNSPLTRAAASFLGRVSGYTPMTADGLAAYGGLTDWLYTLGIPAFTFEVGKGKNPLPEESASFLYACLRETLFRSLVWF